MLVAAYGLYRTTTREVKLAHEQADFVSAVSHEFRTPLTSMRHLTDLLVSRGVTSEERRTQYYGLLANETERLVNISIAVAGGTEPLGIGGQGVIIVWYWE